MKLEDWSTAFWILFIVAGALIFLGTYANLFILDIILGIAIIIMGVQKLTEELLDRKHEKEKEKITNTLYSISKWMEDSHRFTRSIKDTTDYRLHNLDQKRMEVEKKTDKEMDKLAKKVKNVEARLTNISKKVARRRVRGARRIIKEY